jgi:hypothetical protein
MRAKPFCAAGRKTNAMGGSSLRMGRGSIPQPSGRLDRGVGTLAGEVQNRGTESAANFSGTAADSAGRENCNNASRNNHLEQFIPRTLAGLTASEREPGSRAAEELAQMYVWLGKEGLV